MGANASKEEPRQHLQQAPQEKNHETPPGIPRNLDWEKCAYLHNKILDIGWAAVGEKRKQRSWWDYYFGERDPSQCKSI
jgi:hypothetical protein